MMVNPTAMVALNLHSPEPEPEPYQVRSHQDLEPHPVARAARMAALDEDDE
jgi:hypothetical protein